MANKLFLVGIDNYKHHSKLNSSVRDILGFKEILLEKYNFSEDGVYELLNERATNKNIQDGLQGYVKTATVADNLVIYFTGHGDYDEKTDRGFWIPVDGGNDYTTWIPNDTIITLLSKIPCKHIFLICDCCFSNSLLITSQGKSILDYNKHPSRWALTSSYVESRDSDTESNTLFAETIINYFSNTEKDFRVSELIEEVKRAFSANLLQKPQGCPLHVQGHRGGEFVFEIKQDVDGRKLKGYPDFIKTLRLYRRSSNFTEIASREDKTKKVGFQLIQEVDNVIKKATYYLYLYEGINQTQTLNVLKEFHNIIFKDKNLVIFIPLEKGLRKQNTRKKNIEDKFKPVNIFFIDDFIREQCTPSIIQEETGRFLSISNFVAPIIKTLSVDMSVENYLSDWLDKSEEPLMVVKGTGGIGKTTFAQYVADIAKLKNNNATILFIDSVLIKDSLIKNRRHGSFRVYDFYEALFSITESLTEKLSEEVFTLNIDAGNIILVIDGLDEVISKIPEFNVKDFISSIKDSSKNLGGGKVIITCRTHFWDAIQEKGDFTEIELEPFNKQQAQIFFEKSFQANEAKVKKGLRLAEEFRFPEDSVSKTFDPYVLDIIRSIVSNEVSTLETDLSLFSSKLLKSEIKNDYIIYRVCDRERKRIGQISVDDQIKFFIHLAVVNRGFVRSHNFKNEIEDALNRRIDSSKVESFKSHPFLKKDGSAIVFRYDFLADIFKSIYINSNFDFGNISNKVDKHFLEVVGENCWMGSTLNQEVVNRIKIWNDESQMVIADIIEQIIKKQDLSLPRKTKTIANLFNLALTINFKFLTNDITTNTTLLIALFGTREKTIKNLALVNISADHKIRFDFSGLEISNAYIDNYNGFWNCNFDSKTAFHNSTFLNLSLLQKSSTVTSAEFIDCTFDSEAESSLNRIVSRSENRVEQSKLFLNDFLHLFFSNGRLGRQWEDKVISPRYVGINKYNHEYKKTIKTLKRNGLLMSADEKEGVKLFIHDEHKEDVIRFIKDGTISNLINTIIKEL